MEYGSVIDPKWHDFEFSTRTGIGTLVPMMLDIGPKLVIVEVFIAKRKYDKKSNGYDKWFEWIFSLSDCWDFRSMFG